MLCRILKFNHYIRNDRNQSNNSNILLDFRFYDDPSDEFRDGLGTLLPLWKFSYGKFKSIEITGLCWNSAYKDLFVASLGSCKSKSMRFEINHGQFFI